ncbi:hypothetical protein [Ulvibacter antarcticus]|uniref:Lipoprotein n=1 Tax=Ulvibacter antarcticus TaxID=442714 RepID=A0A3L9YWS3_9FLAO|nr:hypothetical protein [Ulvibacter antarcticus]RMA58902.1 hypothetical protein BXY75_2284 [Ulvibacter antarcticus]
MKTYARFLASIAFICLLITLVSCPSNSLSSPIDDVGSIDVPKFPWPPPNASAKKDLPNEVFSNAIYFKDVDSIISTALENNGYVDRSYFTVPSEENLGFVIVTQMEQINTDATSKPEKSRWNTTLEVEDISLSDYLKAIFFSEKGYYRVIVFVVTDLPFQQTGEIVERETALSWLQIGTNKLPDSVCYTPYNDAYTVTALIYEYELKENEDAAALQKPSKHTGKTHLLKSKLWDEIAK